MVTLNDEQNEILIASNKALQRKANTLGANGNVYAEQFFKEIYVPLNHVFNTIPDVVDSIVDSLPNPGYNFATPVYEDFPTIGTVGTRYNNVRLHPVVTSGINGPNTIQSFMTVSAAPANDSTTAINAVRLLGLIAPDFSPQRTNASDGNPTTRGFELALFPAKSNGGIGNALVADTSRGPIPITADPSAVNGIGDGYGHWSVDYDAGIIRFTDAPLNGSTGIMNPNNVFANINGIQVASTNTDARITMFATFYQYTGAVQSNQNLQFVTVGDGIQSFGIHNGTTESAVNAAIIDLTSVGGNEGGFVFIKPGTYTYLNAVTVPANIKIIGDGYSAVITKATSQAGFILSGSYSGVEGLTILSTGSTSGSPADIVLGSLSNNQTITNVSIKNNRLYAYNDAYGVSFAPSNTGVVYNDIEIAHNHFLATSGYTYITHLGFDSTQTGIVLQKINIHDNNFADVFGNNAISLIAGNTIVTSGKDLIVANNILEQSNININIPTINNFKIINNTLYSLSISDGYATNVIDNYIGGILNLAGNVNEIVVSENFINNLTFGTYSSVTSFGLTVLNNTFQNNISSFGATNLTFSSLIMSNNNFQTLSISSSISSGSISSNVFTGTLTVGSAITNLLINDNYIAGAYFSNIVNSSISNNIFGAISSINFGSLTNSFIINNTFKTALLFNSFVLYSTLSGNYNSSSTTISANVSSGTFNALVAESTISNNNFAGLTITNTYSGNSINTATILGSNIENNVFTGSVLINGLNSGGASITNYPVVKTNIVGNKIVGSLTIDAYGSVYSISDSIIADNIIGSGDTIGTTFTSGGIFIDNLLYGSPNSSPRNICLNSKITNNVTYQLYIGFTVSPTDTSTINILNNSTISDNVCKSSIIIGSVPSGSATLDNNNIRCVNSLIVNNNSTILQINGQCSYTGIKNNQFNLASSNTLSTTNIVTGLENSDFINNEIGGNIIFGNIQYSSISDNNLLGYSSSTFDGYIATFGYQGVATSTIQNSKVNGNVGTTTLTTSSIFGFISNISNSVVNNNQLEAAAITGIYFIGTITVNNITLNNNSILSLVFDTGITLTNVLIEQNNIGTGGLTLPTNLSNLNITDNYIAGIVNGASGTLTSTHITSNLFAGNLEIAGQMSYSIISDNNIYNADYGMSLSNSCFTGNVAGGTVLGVITNSIISDNLFTGAFSQTGNFLDSKFQNNICEDIGGAEFVNNITQGFIGIALQNATFSGNYISGTFKISSLYPSTGAGATGIIISNNTFNNVSIFQSYSTFGTSAFLASLENFIFSSNIINGSTFAIFNWGGSGTTGGATNNITITNNIQTNSSATVYICSGSNTITSSNYGTMINGNQFAAPLNFGGNTNYYTIIINNIFTSSTNSIVITGGATFNAISNESYVGFNLLIAATTGLTFPANTVALTAATTSNGSAGSVTTTSINQS